MSACRSESEPRRRILRGNRIAAESWLAVVPAAIFLSVACGGKDSQAPTAPTTVASAPAAPIQVSLSARIVENQSRAPIANAKVSAANFSVTTGSDGVFQTPEVTASNSRITIEAPGYLTRETGLAFPNSNPTIDLIRLAAPFDLRMYRELARNAYDDPSNLAPIFRWTDTPSFYIKTTHDSGTAIDPATIEQLKIVISNSVRVLSGNRFGAPVIETGPDDRPSANGWVNVLLLGTIREGVSGDATLGGPRGTMRLRHDLTAPLGSRPGSRCANAVHVSAHEMGHIMGLRHSWVQDPRTNIFIDMLSGWATGIPGLDCPSGGSDRPAATLYHASLMYSRVPGNLDPDRDPPSLFLMNSPQTHSIVVSCSMESMFRTSR